MGKKKKAGKKPAESKLSKKALKKREAELEREIDRREKKAAKKALAASDAMLAAEAKKAGKKGGKKAKASEHADDVPALPTPVGVITASAEGPITPEPEPETPVDLPSRAAIAEAAEKVIAGNSSDAARESAQDALDAVREASDAETDAEIRARVLRKRAARAAAEAEGKKPGSPERTSAMQHDVAADRAERELDRAKAAADAGDVVGAVEAIGQAIEVVETEHGREFTAGASVAADEFAKPSESMQGRPDFETNGNGQYKVKRPTDGKMVGYTRVTTYIACLEDTTALEKWKARILLEGVAAGDSAEVVSTVNDLAHNRDLAIEKARRKDRKGKLEPGELATYVNGAWADFKRGMDRLADEVFEVGGGREKATKGTDIHALCATAAVEGIQPIADMLTEGTITASDFADVEAFLAALDALGAKVIEVERVIVNDGLKVAGRLDYVVMVKLPGETRGRRRVLDLKTGRVDYGTGKIAMQLGLYAESEGYDLETHEREDLKLDRAKAILLHLPAGSGKATAHVVDLALARKGNRLAGDVRAWRNEGKRAIDLKADLLTGSAGA